jgi:hypothetical protein
MEIREIKFPRLTKKEIVASAVVDVVGERSVDKTVCMVKNTDKEDLGREKKSTWRSLCTDRWSYPG